MKFKKIVAVLLTAAVLASVTAGCGSAVDTNAAAAELDDKEISMGVANLIAQCQAAQMEGYLLSYYGEDMWSQDSGGEDGGTREDTVKEGVMENLQEFYLLDAHTADYNVTLSDEEKAAITQAAGKFIADNNSSALKQMSATQETVEEMLRLYTIQSKMRKAIEDTIDTNVSEQECAQKTFSYVRFDKSDASDTDTAADDEAQTDALAKAEDFLAAAADDMEAAAEASEYTVSTCSYGSGDLNADDNTTGMDVAVLEAADKLKDGKTADSLAETDSAYYVIRMDSTDDKDAAEKKKDSILSERRTDKYDEVLQGYKDSCEWKINEDAWSKVNFDKLYTITTTKTDTSTDDTGTESGTSAETEGGTSADDAGAESGTSADDAGTEGGTSTDGAGAESGTSTDGAETEGGTSADGAGAEGGVSVDDVPQQ